MGRTKTIADEQILNHAREIFRAGGHSASTREVARAAGISQAVLYQRFGSKEELFTRAMTPEPPDLEEILGPYPPRSARADLKRIAERIASYLVTLVPTLLHVVAHPDLRRDQLAHWHERLPFHALVAALTERFQRMREDGLMGRVDPASSAKAFLAAIHSAALVDVLAGGTGQRRPHVQVDGLVDVLWTGLAPQRRASVTSCPAELPASIRERRHLGAAAGQREPRSPDESQAPARHNRCRKPALTALGHLQRALCADKCRGLRDTETGSNGHVGVGYGRRGGNP